MRHSNVNITLAAFIKLPLFINAVVADFIMAAFDMITDASAISPSLCDSGHATMAIIDAQR